MIGLKVQLNDFSPTHTFECGQCFRWEKQPDGSFIGVAGGRAARISEENSVVTIEPCSQKDYDEFWREYLDADRDYSKIKETLSANEVLARAISYGSGIRILRQEFTEALFSFIISQRSSIPRIKTCVKRLCERYGNEIPFEDKTLYSFPDVYTLASLTEKDYADLGVGYRASYLSNAAHLLAEGEIDVDYLKKADTLTARKELLKIRGVGDKVCDCVLLFSLGKYDLFPSDVWIKRVMAEYFNTEDAKEAGESLFGSYSGFAQQYLFYWGKEA